jgi:hypothetical protein
MDGCSGCGRVGEPAALVCPGCGAVTELVPGAVAAQAVRRGPQPRMCADCEQVTIVLTAEMVCADCGFPVPEVNARLAERLAADGPGDAMAAPCVGCGFPLGGPAPVAPAVDISIGCRGCGRGLSVPELEFRVGAGLKIKCGDCQAVTLVPDTVWCPKCGLHLRPDGIPELVEAANRQPPG